jgi:hypothetical protein
VRQQARRGGGEVLREAALGDAVLGQERLVGVGERDARDRGDG